MTYRKRVDPMTSSEEELVRRLREEARVFVPASRAYFALNEAADTIERLRRDLAAAQKENEVAQETIDRDIEALNLAREAVDAIRRDLSASHQREEQVRRALETIEEWSSMSLEGSVYADINAEARRALGKDAKS